MGEETDLRCVTGDPPEMLDDGGLVLAHCFGELDIAVKAVHASVDLIASGDVLRRRLADLVPGKTHLERRASHDGKRFARHKAEARVEGEGAIVVGGLYQADAGMIPCD